MDVNEESTLDTVRDCKNNATCLLAHWTSYHVQGQKFYRARKFEDAVKYFTLALEACHDAPLIVRDNRAAAYSMAGNLTAALRDGRKMIQEAKLDCIGYLRTGKILQLMGQHESAMRIYNIGLNKTQQNVADRKLLQVMHSKLAKKLAPSQRIDPLRALPLELLEMVLKYLNFRQVVHIRRLSQAWRRFVDTVPNLWSDLDFAVVCKPMPFKIIREYVSRSKGRVSRVSLGRFTAHEENVTCYIVSRCKELREIEITAGCIGDSILKVASCAFNLRILTVTSQERITSETVMRLLSLCPNLEVAEFSGLLATGWRFDEHIHSPLPNLRSLHLGSLSQMLLRSDHKARTTIPLNKLIRHMPNLRKLSLPLWYMGNLQHTNVQNFAISQTLETLIIPRSFIFAPPGPFLPSSLRRLDMGGCTSEYSLASPIKWNAPPTKLVWLSIAGTRFLPFDQFIGWLEPNKGNLSYLDASGVIEYQQYWVKLGAMGYLNEVTELNLDASGVNDQTMIALSTNLPVLKILHLSHTVVTGVGLKAILTNLSGTLECIYLDGCCYMGLDAVKWARELGIKVSFTFSDDRKRRKPARLDYQ